MPDPNESAEEREASQAAFEEALSGDTPEAGVEPEGAEVTQPSDELTSGEAQAQDDPYGSLRAFLVDFDPGLQGADFSPVDVVIARLSTQKEYLEQFMKQAGELRSEVETLKTELVAVEARAAQKDVRDERIEAIETILRTKIADSARVERIRQLLN